MTKIKELDRGVQADELLEMAKLGDKTALKAKFKAEILERGVIIDRLHVDLPEDVYGEWVPKTDAHITEKQAMGFKIDTEFATARSLHGTGDGSASIGDVVFMTVPKIIKEAIDEVRHEAYVRANVHPKLQREEKEALSLINNRNVSDGAFTGSTANDVRGDEIKNSLANDTGMRDPSIPQ